MTGWDDGAGRPQLHFSIPPLTPMVKRLMLINVAVFVAIFMLGFGPASWQVGVVEFLGVDPLLWRKFVPAVWQLVTYGFVHDLGGLGHLFFNMLMLYFFGTMLEGVIGPRRFLVHYLAAVVIGATLHLILMLLLGRQALAIGASGGVMAVVIAMATLRPHAQVLFIFIPVRLWVLAAVMVAFDVFPLLLELQRGMPTDRVAHFVHLGGAAYGFLAARRGWLWKDPVVKIERKRAVAKEERRIGEEARMDQLLAKINREGLGSLSKEEREFLKRVSERKGR